MKNDTKVLIGVIISTVALVIGGVWMMSNQFNSQGQTAAEPQVFENSVLLPENVNKTSEEINKVVIVEFSDFQCPACASTAPIVKGIVEENPDDITLVYRHFPLVNIHPNAMPAAQAAQAAASQGKFWEMHDKLFENQAAWSDEKNAKDIFVTYAKELELNEEQFLADYESDAVRDIIRRDMTDANLAQVNSTPSFYINGKKVDYVGSKDFVETLETELNK